MGCSSSKDTASYEPQLVKRRQSRKKSIWEADTAEDTERKALAKQFNRRASRPMIDNALTPHAIELYRQAEFDLTSLEMMVGKASGDVHCMDLSKQQFTELVSAFSISESVSANHLFRVFDEDMDDHISFDELVRGLASLALPGGKDKAHVLFNLWDVSGTGQVGLDDIKAVLTSYYELSQLVGAALDLSFGGHTVDGAAAFLLERMDTNKDGVVTHDDFLDAHSLPEVTGSLDKFFRNIGPFWVPHTQLQLTVRPDGGLTGRFAVK